MLDWNKPETWSVLVVDDEKDNLDLVVIFMGMKGAQVRGAPNAGEALEVLKVFKPNLILLDLSMPFVSGWDFLPTLRANPETSTVQTIALTAHAMQSDRRRVLEAGFDGYLTKPINLRTLVSDLEHASFRNEPLKERSNEYP